MRDAFAAAAMIFAAMRFDIAAAIILALDAARYADMLLSLF